MLCPRSELRIAPAQKHEVGEGFWSPDEVPPCTAATVAVLPQQQANVSVNFLLFTATTLSPERREQELAGARGPSIAG